MLCFTFDKCGVYYYSDISGNEAASYIGIIAVKKKPEHHIINYNEGTQKFDQGLFFDCAQILFKNKLFIIEINFKKKS